MQKTADSNNKMITHMTLAIKLSKKIASPLNCKPRKNNFTSGYQDTYNSALMSKSNSFQRLPVEVDPFRLVEQRRILDGRIPVTDFPRLKDLLVRADKSGANAVSENNTIVYVHLEFTHTDTGFAAIQGNIQSDLKMQCQRCLQVKTEPLDSDFQVVLVTSDEQAERLQEGFDTWFVEDQRIFLRDFIEDEILLALPLSVVHDDCKAIRHSAETKTAEAPESENDSAGRAAGADDIDTAQRKDNPFAVLKDLKVNSK